MNSYWFKKTSKGIPTPISWQGWLSFVLVVFVIIQIRSFVSNTLGVFIVAAIVVYGYQQILKRKTAPNTEVYDHIKDSSALSALQIILIILGFIIFFVFAIWVGFKRIDNQKTVANQMYESEVGKIEF